MTETVVPPQPPPPQQQRGTVDFGKALSFVFEDPDWIKKILIGGLFYLLGFLLIGFFFIAGYCARLARNVAAGMARPLPEWDDLGTYFVDGIKIVAIAVIYFLPFLMIFIFAGGGMAVIEEVSSDAADVAAVGFSGVLCLLWVLVFLVGLFIPAALTMAVMHDSFGEGFAIGRIWRFITANIGNYLIAIVIHLVANFISQFGVILLCVGVLFTSFWALLVATWAFAETYRLSPVK